MIKFILFLPIRIIGYIFLYIGRILEYRNAARIEQAKQEQRIIKEQAARTEKEKRDAARLERQAQADRRRIEKEKAAADRKRAADLERKKALQFKAAQAAMDIEHYKIQRTELLKLYSELEKQYSDAATDSKKEILFRKQLALNNQIRGVDRQIEKAQYTINRTA
jgi:hypothetical protein